MKSLTLRAFEEQIDFAQPITGGPVDRGFDYFFGASGCPTCQPPYGWIEDQHFVEEPSIYQAQAVHTSRPGMMGSGGWPPPSDTMPVPGTPGQLYNLADDPAEQVNLYDAQPAMVAELSNLLDEYRSSGRSAPLTTPPS